MKIIKVLVFIIIAVGTFIYCSNKESKSTSSNNPQTTTSSQPAATQQSSNTQSPNQQSSQVQPTPAMPNPNATVDELYLEAVKKIDTGGKSNAQLFIAQASCLAPKNLFNDVNVANAVRNSKYILETLDINRAGELAPLLNSYEPTFAELKKAFKADVNILPLDLPRTPVPNFLNLQNIAKSLAIKGMIFEQQKDFNNTIDMYLTEVQYSSCVMGNNATLITGMISINSEQLGNRLIKNFIIGHPEDIANMHRIIKTLSKIDKSRLPCVGLLESEKKINDAVYGTFDIERLISKKGIDATENGVQVHYSYKEILAKKDRLPEDYKKVWDYTLTVFGMPYPDFKRENYSEKLKYLTKDMNPLMKVDQPNFPEAKVRYVSNVANNRIAQIMAALEAYFTDKKQYPKALSELAPGYLPTIPKDPFSENDFKYSKNGNAYCVYSVGPDFADNKKSVIYDPTNGSISGGDIAER